MNTANIKKYAPKARARFIDTMTRQATRVGISPDGKGGAVIAPLEQKGDVLVMTAQDGQTHTVPAHLKGAREALAAWVQRDGFTQAIEQAAYSWFNRLCAIRYMEIHGYLDHGRRVLSGAGGEAGQYQLLDECLEVDLPALDKSLDTARVRELKLDGTQDETLYRELLLAQCHALHEAMPFLFEPLDDASELLLPNNLTKTDSLIRELVEAIPEEDWQDVEVIGWLYQFYISEKKDQVIGKVVKSEDIPAATQLFTPNWIVQYLVQNSVGRQWLQTYPDSPLKGEMPYYIEPAEQEPEVQAQLDAITPASIDPETIKVLDPACGSGHILVEAYNVLKAIYEERGYRSRDIPKLILENNLFGLDIDDRAAQLAGFALLMKAREDDRRILTRLADSGVRLNVLAMQSSQHLDANTLWQDLNLTGASQQGQSQHLFESEQQDLASNDATYQVIVELIERFQDAKTFGSLIEVPNELEAPLKALLEQLEALTASGDTLQKTAAQRLRPIVQQAWVLAQRYDAVVANPPYMGNVGMNKKLKKLAQDLFSKSKTDLFSVFIEKCISFGKVKSEIGLVTPYVWMFIKSYENIRKKIIEDHTLSSLVQLEYNAFLPACIPVCSFTISNYHLQGYRSKYIRLSDFKGHENQAPKFLEAINNPNCGWLYEGKPERFKLIPGAPIGYWADSAIFKAFADMKSFKDFCYASVGIQTGNNDKFMRGWQEVSFDKIEFDQNPEGPFLKKWYPCASGGSYRKWYGNQSLVVNYKQGGGEIIEHGERTGKTYGFNGSSYYFMKSITWPKLTSSSSSFRATPQGCMFDGVGVSAFFDSDYDYYAALSLLNSNTYSYLIEIVAPTLSFTPGDFIKLPYPSENKSFLKSLSVELIDIHKKDWDRYEISYGFKYNPIIICEKINIREAFESCLEDWANETEYVKDVEESLNREAAHIFGLNSYSEKIDLRKITLYSNIYYRYTGSGNNHEKKLRHISDVVGELISYSIGCMMGRYSLDKPGLILASQGETVRDYLAQIPEPSFAPDDNAIIPLTDQEWFPDDATNRFRDFVRTVWGEEGLQENLDFVAESLCLHAIKPKKGEAALDTIRRYLSTQFFKDHLRTYKKRPIYWLFSSGKQKAFECLVYLHRYTESTLAEMRTDYVIPLTTKLASYVEKLEQDKDASHSAADTKRIEKELSKLYKQQAELNTFDEKLRHYADQRISLDLDDGVKVNYGKFGDLLAEVKQVVGKSRSE
ncbi:BREX-1 system adenine-specific DNA-methyltransferase PglX [Halomonas sp. AOP42-C2-23]|uniref:BREX-1 system adenine-specific DNA-methyltransferase PglX n=1 Tax=Halomonas sp. AOP42-C2-23 TaxID=3457669 RepID=UPI00403481B7